MILPSGVGALHVSVDGSSQSLEQMPSGYQRLRRTWKPGDTARVKLDFLPRAHFHRDRDGIRWLDFTYGPWALAQAAEADRDIGIPVQAESEDAPLWIETAGEGASTLSFRLKGTGGLCAASPSASAALSDCCPVPLQPRAPPQAAAPPVH